MEQQIKKKIEIKQLRAELKRIGVKNPMYYFTIKYPKYKWIDTNDSQFNKIDNLWYGKTFDDDFLIKLRAFVEYKRVEFN